MERSSATWRKATRSHEDGDACIELAAVPHLNKAVWRKAARSTVQNDNCVEIASVPRAVAIRDSKDPDGSMIIMDRNKFREFVGALREL